LGVQSRVNLRKLLISMIIPGGFVFVCAVFAGMDYQQGKHIENTAKNQLGRLNQAKNIILFTSIFTRFCLLYPQNLCILDIL
jgi:hypothetical protein